ncbi:MAG: PspA-associated protein PspAA [Acidimicrobiales bacterium]
MPEADMPAVEQLDAQLTDAMDRSDAAAFTSTLGDLVNLVRHSGTHLPADDLRTSGLVVPHEGSSLAEVKDLLAGES